MWPVIFDMLFVALIVGGIGLVAVERYGTALLTIIGVLFGLWLLCEPFKTFVIGIGWQTLLVKWLPIYLAIGVGVALIKWFFHIMKMVSAINDAKETFKNTAGGQEAKDPASRRVSFVNHFIEHNKYKNSDYFSENSDYFSVSNVSQKRWNEEGIVAELLTPRAKNHIDRITFWVLEWPYVIIATIFDDIIIKFAHNIARFFDWAFTTASRFWIARSVKDI